MSSSSVTANRKPLRSDAERAIRAKECGCCYTKFARINRIQSDPLRKLIKQMEEESAS